MALQAWGERPLPTTVKECSDFLEATRAAFGQWLDADTEGGHEHRVDVSWVTLSRACYRDRKNGRDETIATHERCVRRRQQDVDGDGE